VGLDVERRGIAGNWAPVEAIGAVESGDAAADFLEFVGQGKPGYSGGPVFDTNSNVVAVMREAWLQQSLRGGTARLMNRAFSLEPVSKFLEERTPAAEDRVAPKQ
jgi:hypothetical protein